MANVQVMMQIPKHNKDADPSTKNFFDRVKIALQPMQGRTTADGLVNYVEEASIPYVGVVRGRLKDLDKQVTTHTYCAVRDQLLSIASRRGHIDLVEYLLSLGADVNSNQGEALRNAVLHDHAECVELLVSRPVHATTVQCALLVTDFLEISHFRKMAELLLNLDAFYDGSSAPYGIPSDVLDYLIMKHLAGGAEHTDDIVMKMLLKAQKLPNAHARTSPDEQSKHLVAYVALQKNILALHGRGVVSASASYSRKLLPISTTTTNMRRRKRQFFSDDILDSTEDIMIKLLRRYMHMASQMSTAAYLISDVNQMFIERLPLGVDEHPIFRDKVLAYDDWRRGSLFCEQLLQHRPLAKSTLLLIPAWIILRSREMTTRFFSQMDQHESSLKEYRDRNQGLLHYACRAHQFSAAILVCQLSYVQLSLDAVKACIARAAMLERHVGDITSLLELTRLQASTLEYLWQSFTTVNKFPISIAQGLLRAGYVGPGVDIFLKGLLRSAETIAHFHITIDAWKTSKLLDTQESYDYLHMIQKYSSSLIPRGTGYFRTLGNVLGHAIQEENPEACKVLLEREAPLVLHGHSVLAKTIAAYAESFSLQRKEILQSILEAERKRGNHQHLLEYALLQAVKSKCTWQIHVLINQGASTVVDAHESCWRAAIRYGEQALFDALLSDPRIHGELGRALRTGFADFTKHSTYRNLIVHSLGLMHRAGFVEADCYISILRLHGKSASPDAISTDEVIVNEFGVGTSEFVQMLETSWMIGDLSIFKLLWDQRTPWTVAEIFIARVLTLVENSRFVLCNNDGREFDPAKTPAMLSAIELLLKTIKSVGLLDRGLHSISLLSKEPDSARVPVLISLLKKGARFMENGGIALLHCLLIDDAELSQLIRASKPSVEVCKEALRLVFELPADLLHIEDWQRVLALSKLITSCAQEPGIVLSDQTLVDFTIMFLSGKQPIPTQLIQVFFDLFPSQSQTGLCDLSLCPLLEHQLQNFMDDLQWHQQYVPNNVENAAAVLDRMTRRPEATEDVHRMLLRKFWITAGILDRALILASRSGSVPIVQALLGSGADGNAKDESGTSALELALSTSHPLIARMLRDAGAQLEDGCLHKAMLNNQGHRMEILLDGGHHHKALSKVYGEVTPLVAFMKHNHGSCHYRPSGDFDVVEILMNRYHPGRETFQELQEAFELALCNAHAYLLISAFIPWITKHAHADILASLPIICKGSLRYSFVSLVEYWPLSCLSDAQRISLAARLKACGFSETYYAVDGEQPENAVNVPRVLSHATEMLKKCKALEEKECCTHLEKVDAIEDIHAGLMSTCAKSHGWDDDIICSDCLKQYLELRMFPHDEITIKYKFASTKVACWFPKCASTSLQHSVLQLYVDPEIFRLYDLALCQSLLRDGVSMLKCATPDCPGASWVEEDGADNGQNKHIFFCEICSKKTCTECNDLYEKHDNQPCPVSEAKKSERVKAEEELSTAVLKNEKRCPKCSLLYTKYDGCDHIVCGKNAYDNKVDKGCRYDFCDVCFGAWRGGHLATCIHSTGELRL